MKIFCIDLKSFYASVECSLRNLDPFNTPLVVADISRGEGSIILAVTPFLKKIGVPSRLRIFELPKNIDIIYAKPRMARYMDFSKKIYKIYLKYLSKDDIHVYSIDEAFLDFTNYPIYNNITSEELALKIIEEIYIQTKITAVCGIGENMFMAKLALDVFAKNTLNNIYILNKENFYQKAWPLSIDLVWGIGHNIGKRLKRKGIYTLQDLAKTNKEILEKEFGIIGNELHEHAWGLDDSKVADIRVYQPINKSINYGQVLFEDYNREDILVVLHEMVEEVSYRLIDSNQECKVISLNIGYSSDDEEKGFTCSCTLENNTSSVKILYEAFKQLLEQNIGQNKIRIIRLSVSNLNDYLYHKVSFFENSNELVKEREVSKVSLAIKKKYGRNAVFTASSLTQKGTQLKRNKLIGGHNAE